MGRGCSGPARVAWYVETYEAWEQVPACWAEYPAMVSDLQAAMELRLAIDAETAGDMLAAARGGADWHDYRGRLMERGRVPWGGVCPAGRASGAEELGPRGFSRTPPTGPPGQPCKGRRIGPQPRLRSLCVALGARITQSRIPTAPSVTSMTALPPLELSVDRGGYAPRAYSPAAQNGLFGAELPGCDEHLR